MLGWDRPKRNKEEEMAQIIETDNSTPEDKEEEVAEVNEMHRAVYGTVL